MKSAKEFIDAYDVLYPITAELALKGRDTEMFDLGVASVKKKAIEFIEQRIAMWRDELDKRPLCNDSSYLEHRYDARESEGIVIRDVIKVLKVNRD